MSTTFIFHLKFNFAVVATTIVDIVITITIINIIINKFNFIIMNMHFISAAIDTHYTISTLEKILKMKNKCSIENLNENCIHRKLDSYKLIKN